MSARQDVSPRNHYCWAAEVVVVAAAAAAAATMGEVAAGRPYAARSCAAAARARWKTEVLEGLWPTLGLHLYSSYQTCSAQIDLAMGYRGSFECAAAPTQATMGTVVCYSASA